MSKIGKKAISLPAGVSVTNTDGIVTVAGPKGTLQYEYHPTVDLSIEENQVVCTITNNDNFKFRGLVRSLINNMVVGVSTGYQIKLNVIGVGFNVKQQGNVLTMNLGYSHPVVFTLPESVSAEIVKDPKGFDIIVLDSIDKQLIGQVASKIRSLRAPEPYKGKGIRYSTEVIKLKAGKTAKK